MEEDTPTCHMCGISHWTVTLYEFEKDGKKVVVCQNCLDDKYNVY